MSKKEILVCKLLKLFCWTLTIALGASKVFFDFSVSWAMVFSPLIIPVAMSLILFLVAEVIDAIVAMKDR